jgi:U6 snRNA-associated Sm-like protein LSm7
MSERAAFRGARGGRGNNNSNRGEGGHSRGGRGGGRGGGESRGGGNLGAKDDKPKKENILDLGKYSDKRIIVKFNGGREGKRGFSRNSRGGA